MLTKMVHGLSVPSMMYGTAWKEERTAELTSLALAAGFRAIDTANQRKHYVEAQVGEAVARFIAGGQATREQLFLQTKFTHADGQDHRMPYDKNASPREQVMQSFESSLQHLQTSYLDSYVLHGPSLAHGFSDEDWEIWRAMGELWGAKRTHLLGVSNVSLAHLRALFASGEAKPAFVQNRCYARAGWDRAVRELCRAHDVAYQGFSLLTANRRELSHPSVTRIVARTGRTLPEVVFRFALQVGMIPLTGTTDARHMREDLSVLDFALEDDEVAAIERVAG
jgi:diketogulonate reductase-like aldo/keto reductase